MEEAENKYSPSHVLEAAASFLFLKEELKGKIMAGGLVPTSEFRIFIRNREAEETCYLIIPEGIFEGRCSGSTWRKRDDTILSENFSRLGSVIVQRKDTTIKEYLTYEDVWKDVGRE